MFPQDERNASLESRAFKDILRGFRLRAGLSQEALAERAHLSVRAISDLERGAKLWPRPETLQLLALALDLAPQDRAAMAVAARRPSSPRIPPELRQGHAAQSPATPLGNLSAQPTTFVGRDHELADAMALLETHRLATITGSGGVGKTRLALRIAGELTGSYAEGVWQVELARLNDGALVPQALASVLGLREEPGRVLGETITDHLKSRQVLLVLDNCEHLIAACAELVTVLLHCCPLVHVIATSREGLRVPGEAIYRVPSMSLPQPGTSFTPERLLTFEAIQLFVERARERRFDFALTAANARAVAEICCRLDGIPLAIELAAARIGALTAQGIAERLDDTFRLLSSGPRTVQPHHQTLRATLDWSQALLSERERTLLRRLSVFVDGWTLDAAEAVCAGDLASPPISARTSAEAASLALEAAWTQWTSPLDHSRSLLASTAAQQRLATPVILGREVLDLLDELVNKSLVLMHEGDQGARYRLLDTVRQYEGEQLEAAGETALIRNRHLDWCLALAAQAEQGLTGPEQRSWLSRLEGEHDNLRAALAWSLHELETQAAGMELAARLLLFWEGCGHLTEARRWLNDLLERGSAAPPGVRARALHCAGALAGSQGDYASAEALLEESLAFQRGRADTKGIASVLQPLGLIALYKGDYDRAVALCQENVAHRRKIGESWGIAAALGNLGYALYLHGDSEQARMLHEESLALRRNLGNKRGIASSLNDLGLVAWSQHDYSRAAALHEESLALRRELGDKGGIASSLENLGEVALAEADYGRAAVLFSESLELSQEIGDKQVMAYCLEGIATVALAEGTARHAAELFGAAEALRERIGLPLPPAARAGYDRSTASVRAALGHEASTDAWNRGRSLPLDQVVALALVPAVTQQDVRPLACTPALQRPSRLR